MDDFVHAILVTARGEVASGKTLQKVNTHPVGVKWYEIEQSNPEWRGVVWQDPADPDRYWLVSAGKHQEDGGNDFWKRLARIQDLFTLQPTDDDYKRHALEEPLRQAASFGRDAQEMCKAALSALGVIQRKHLFGADVELVISDLGGGGLIKVGITVRGSAHADIPIVVLRAVCPFVGDDDWLWDPADDVAGDMRYETLCEFGEIRT